MSTAVIGYMPMPVNFEYTHRAKIFSAFDALAGFDGWIASKEVRYCDRRYLSEEEHDNLDRKLSVLRTLTRNSREVRRNKPVVTVQYFSPCTDRNSFAYGTGGLYETVSGICRKIDDVAGTITIGETVIPLDDITLSVSDEATGIRQFDAETENSESIYNLSGQKVSKNYKGITIRNGKKVITR